VHDNDDFHPNVEKEEANKLASYPSGPSNLSFLTSYVGHVTRNMLEGDLFVLFLDLRW